MGYFKSFDKTYFTVTLHWPWYHLLLNGKWIELILRFSSLFDHSERFYTTFTFTHSNTDSYTDDTSEAIWGSVPKNTSTCGLDEPGSNHPLSGWWAHVLPPEPQPP